MKTVFFCRVFAMLLLLFCCKSRVVRAFFFLSKWAEWAKYKANLKGAFFLSFFFFYSILSFSYQNEQNLCLLRPDLRMTAKDKQSKPSKQASKLDFSLILIRTDRSQFVAPTKILLLNHYYVSHGHNIQALLNLITRSQRHILASVMVSVCAFHARGSEIRSRSEHFIF